MKLFRGRGPKKAVGGCTVEVETDGHTTQLSLEKSLQVVNHSPTGFQWDTQAAVPPNLPPLSYTKSQTTSSSHAPIINCSSLTT